MPVVMRKPSAAPAITCGLGVRFGLHAALRDERGDEEPEDAAPALPVMYAIAVAPDDGERRVARRPPAAQVRAALA